MLADTNLRSSSLAVARTQHHLCRTHASNNRTAYYSRPAPHGHRLQLQSLPTDKARRLADSREAPPYTSEPPAASEKEEEQQFVFEPGPLSNHPAPLVTFVSLFDGKYTVRGRLLLPASAARVYSILTDYDNCHRVFTNIAASEVVLTEDGGLQVMQTCRWKFFAFSGTFRVHLGVREDSLRGTLLFSLVQSNFMRDFEGQWTVRPTEARMLAKTGTEEWCEVEHQLSVVPSVPVPLPLSYYTRSIFVRQVEGILADLQRAILATVAAEQTAEPTSVAALAASVMERARRI